MYKQFSSGRVPKISHDTWVDLNAEIIYRIGVSPTLARDSSMTSQSEE